MRISACQEASIKNLELTVMKGARSGHIEAAASAMSAGVPRGLSVANYYPSVPP